MKYINYKLVFLISLCLIITICNSCSTTKSKEDETKFKKLYHNTTSRFNGYFNAQLLMDATMVSLQDMHQDNYNGTLEVYDYITVDNPLSVAPDMDKAIEKVSTITVIHENSNYVDDCYLLMGKAQYLKQDYASAEETLLYFEEQFNPKNPYGRAYVKSKNDRNNGKRSNDEIKEERKIKEKEREEAKKVREKEDKERRKEREEANKKRKKESKDKSKRGGKTRAQYEAEREAKKAKADADAAAKVKAEEAKVIAEEQAKIKAAEKAKEDKKAAKKAALKDQGEGAVFKNKTAYYEGLYWLARTYIETNRYSSASTLLDRLADVAPLENGLDQKLPAARAHLLMKTGDMDEAIYELENAIELEDDKGLRARYAFIQGQLHEQSGNTPLAYDAYKRSSKLSPDYELKFNAALNELKLSYKTGQTTKPIAIKKLEKMEKEAKNKPFQDQIYFTMAQIRLDSKDVVGAIADFENAIAVSGNNKNVQLEAHYKLAQLLFEQGEYRECKKCYDKTLALMPKSDNRQKEASRFSKNLADIATNIEIIELQDSLMKLSRLSESELSEIAKVGLEEREKNNKDDLGKKPEDIRKGAFANQRPLNTGRSSFFAYNSVALNQGKVEFKRLWKDRTLEDNWRRSLRTDLSAESIVTADGLGQDEDKVYTEQELKDYLRDIPRNDAQKKSANRKIQNALFNLGVLFRERLRDYENSIVNLERLVREYPEYDKRDEALFYIYLSYQDLEKYSKSDDIIRKMKSEYPDSKFTKLATDPTYAASLKASEDNIGAYYDRTYILFEQGNHQAVVDRVADKSRLFKEKTDYDAKLALIGAMSTGNLQGKDAYRKSLEQLVKRYAKTPEEVKAKEIIRFLKGDKEAFDEILYDEALDKFTMDDKKLHYIFIVTYNLDQKLFQKAKIAISNYNKKYHRSSNLQISTISLNPAKKTEIILVRSFENKLLSMQYYSGVEKNLDDFINKIDTKKAGDEDIPFDIYPITQKNYREVIKQRSIQSYRSFFDKQYLKKG